MGPDEGLWGCESTELSARWCTGYWHECSAAPGTMCAGLASHGSKCVECQSKDWLLGHDGDGERCRPPKDEFHPDEHSHTGAVRAQTSRPTHSAPFRDNSFCRLPSDLSACWLATHFRVALIGRTARACAPAARVTPRSCATMRSRTWRGSGSTHGGSRWRRSRPSRRWYDCSTPMLLLAHDKAGERRSIELQ